MSVMSSFFFSYENEAKLLQRFNKLKSMLLCAMCGRSGGGAEFVDELPFVVFVIRLVAVEECILVVACSIVFSHWRV